MAHIILRQVEANGRRVGVINEDKAPYCIQRTQPTVLVLSKPNSYPNMNLLVILLILLLLLGGGGFYFGGPVYGGSGIGLILLICLIIFLTGGFRR